MGSEHTHATDSDMSGIFDDATFNSLQYDNYASADSPFDANRFFNLSAADNVDSPNFDTRTPPRSVLDIETNSTHQRGLDLPPRSLVSSRSAESSSQDSSSEASVRRKRKTTSESPPTENMAGLKVENNVIKPEDTMMASNNFQDMQQFERSMQNLPMDQDFMSGSSAMTNHFDFDSAASSPGGMGAGGYSAQTPVNHSGPPGGTIEPAQFFMGSTNASPNSIKASNTADGSPAAMFANPVTTSGAPDMFSNSQMWGAQAQNPAWNNDYSNAFASPGALGLTPSPVANEPTSFATGPVPVEDDRVPLHIGPIPSKSRVETQINIRMTVDRLPPGIKRLHLPTHTIAKAKLLSKEGSQLEDCLELHTMLVCTSAMTQPHLRQRALQKAASQNNNDIQARGVAGGIKKEEDELDEEDKPANGGEVRICQNCINRERKRAARKKLKKEEEQAHWEKYETERVIVFNTNEFKEWLEWQQSPPPKDNSLPAGTGDMYPPSETAMQVTAPMRIACYCRHQNEKDGFQVIFTIKDHQGKVVAQQISDSILITDDHKTHPLANMPGHVWYNGEFAAPAFGTSQSMIDLHSQMPAMPMSKSTGNLQAMGFGPGQPFQSSSSMHPMPGYPSQSNTPGTMTPRNLSRPASPTGLGQAGPSKKRKSSSAHRRMPSGLAMTRVDTSQPPGGAAQSAVSNATPFSPTGGSYTPGGDGSYISLPHSGSRAQYHTQPPTPNESSFPYGALNRTSSLDNTNFQAFYSAPSSAHQSRAASPVLQGPNLAAFQRQQAHGGSSNLPIRGNPFAVQTPPTSAPAPMSAEPERPNPIINKVTPSEGPISGGIEVSIYGQGFTPGMDVMFGDRIATATTYWGEKALCCVLPPGQVGAVPVAIAPSHGRQYQSPGPAQAFRYTNETSDRQMMEMALRFYAMKMTGSAETWQSTAQDAANLWITGAVGGMPPGPYPGQ